MTGSEENTTGGLSDANDMAGSWSGQDAILTDEKLLDTICRANFSNQLDNFGIPVSAVTTDDKESTLCAFRNREEDRSDEGLAVVRLLEDSDLFAQTRSARPIQRGVRECLS